MPENQNLHKLAPVLSRVSGPGQYVGGEHNQVCKPDAKLRLALAFPDAYAVGMSHHGLRILYDIANALPEVSAERVFAPFPDMEEALRKEGLRLSTLETSTPLERCQVVGFSLSYELAATSVLTILDLGGIALTRRERENTDAPIVIAGGAAVMNPEPMSDFIDVFVIGEAEEALPELLSIVREALPLRGGDRTEVLARIAKHVSGAYVPQFYERPVNADGSLGMPRPTRGDIPARIRRRIVHDFNGAHQVTRPVVPIHETVHERAVLEIMRGCPNGCRFCQAGYATRPQREREPGSLLEAARAGLSNTGYDEVGLLSLSTSNYSRFDALIEILDGECAPRGVSLSLPSLRVDHALTGIPSRVSSVRKSGLTVAPEAGSDRLRAVINKDVKNDDLLSAAEEAFRRGWRQMKLYFMVGLPTEEEEDVLAIARLSEAAARTRGRPQKGGGGRPAIHLSVSNFIPKVFTAFQWCGAAHPDVWSARQRLVAENVNRRMVAYHGHDVGTSLLEAVMSRGDARLGGVILSAWRGGARLDGWTEHFRPGVWGEAFRGCGLDAVGIATRGLEVGGELGWGHVDVGFVDGFLEGEYWRGMGGGMTGMCGEGSCAGCGVEGCGFVGK